MGIINATGYTPFEQVVFTGNDIATYDNSRNNPNINTTECVEKCNNNNNCIGIAYTGGKCTLKSTIEKLYSDGGDYMLIKKTHPLSKYTFSKGVDVNVDGNAPDIKTINTTLPNECAIACNAHASCVGFVTDSSQSQSLRQMTKCWLKPKIDKPLFASTRNTYGKLSDTVGKYTISNRNINSETINTIKTNSLSECSSACDNNPNCAVFVTDRPMTTCMLKQSVGVITDDNTKILYSNYSKAIALGEAREAREALSKNASSEISWKDIGSEISWKDIGSEISWKDIGNFQLTTSGKITLLLLCCCCICIICILCVMIISKR